MAVPVWSATSTTGAKEELQQLRARIAALQEELAEAETSRMEAADALRESERAISEASRELAGLDLSSQTVSQRKQVLSIETRKASEALAGQQKELARLLQVQHVQSGTYVEWMNNQYA